MNSQNKHTYFDSDGNKIQNEENFKIKGYTKKTGIGSYNLWCGNHKYFSGDKVKK